MTLKSFLILGAAACLLVACSPHKSPPAKTAAKDLGPYKTSLQVSEVMAHVIAPAAYDFWNASGFVSDAAGTRSLRPDTDAGWLKAENGAAGVAEGANLLMLPGRRRDEGDWIRYAQAVSALGIEALAATDARDSDRMFEVGGRLNEACEACHAKYSPKTAY